MPTPVEKLSESTWTALAALESSLVSGFLDEWPSSARQRPVDPTALPVLAWLARIATAVPFPVAPELITALLQATPLLAWRQTYTADEMDLNFLDNYGYAELVGLNGPRCSERLACGFLLLGPDTFYPRHQHAAEEIYVPLFGHAQWQQGDSLWRTQVPGTLIHHRRDEPHAMRTRADPLLAIYLWRGANLAEQSRLSD